MNTELIYKFSSHTVGDSNIKAEPSTVLESLPNKITWEYDGTKHSLDNKNKLIPLLLKDKSHIAVIEAPYNNVFNNAFIIDGTGKIVWNIKMLLNEQIKNSLITFYDVYYIKDILYFFVKYMTKI